MRTKEHGTAPPLVITGAAGGLGRAFAVEAARRGWSLVLTDVAPLDDLAAYLRATYGTRVEVVPADLATSTGRDRLFAALPGDGVGGLVNVAGVDHEGSFEDRGPGGPPRHRPGQRRGDGRRDPRAVARRDRTDRFVLITVCSLAAVTPMPFKATYAASKRFLLDFSLALREELAEVATVTALCPAGLPTSAVSVRGIFSQGVLGRLSAVSPGQAAVAALDAAEADRAVCVPGTLNRALFWLARVVPTRLAVHATGRRWAAARRDVFRVAEEALDATAREVASLAPRAREVA